jgi:hypothetical protein
MLPQRQPYRAANPQASSVRIALLVGLDEEMLPNVQAGLERLGYQVQAVTREREALLALREPSLVLVIQEVPPGSVAGLIRRAFQANTKTQFVFVWKKRIFAFYPAFTNSRAAFSVLQRAGVRISDQLLSHTVLQ